MDPGAGNAEQERRNQCSALFGIVGAFRRDNASNIPFAEFVPVLARLDNVPVGDPVHDGSAKPGNETDYHADEGATHDDEFVTDGIPDSVNPPLAQLGGSGNGSAQNQQVDDFREGEEAQTHDHQGHSVHEVVKTEGVPVFGYGRRISQYTQHQADARPDDAFQGLIARQHPPPWTYPSRPA